MRLSLVVDLADFTDPGYRARQEVAWASLCDYRNPSWLHLEPVRAGQCGIRDAFTEGKSDRHLTYVRDLLEAAMDNLNGRGFAGFLNSDIIVTPRFFELMEHAFKEKVDTVVVHRADLIGDSIQQVHNYVDGFFVDRSAWDLVWEASPEFPDMLAGEPGWGDMTMVWASTHKLSRFHMKDCAVLHQQHKAYWKQCRRGIKTSGYIHNRELHHSFTR